jgi:hypothetical protein
MQKPDTLRIYLNIDDDTWVYYHFAGNILKTTASITAYNNQIKEVLNKQNKKKLDPTKHEFQLAPCDEENKDLFLKLFSRYLLTKEGSETPIQDTPKNEEELKEENKPQQEQEKPEEQKPQGIEKPTEENKPQQEQEKPIEEQKPQGTEMPNEEKNPNQDLENLNKPNNQVIPSEEKEKKKKEKKEKKKDKKEEGTQEEPKNE